MAGQIKCECGHENPKGTEICQSCGKPFDNKNELLNMRYEGAARRSKTYKKTWVDRVWNFFASVKVGIWLMAITLVASMLGTIFPQELFIPSNADPIEYYPDRYGFAGYIYVLLGLHDMYSSFWYIGLLVMIGISLAVTSVDRGIPLYRSLKKQRVTRHLGFLSRQRIHGSSHSDHPVKALEQAKEALAQKRYKVREEERAILGEKGRFSRWGAYVVHVGLIIFLLGVLMRILPGFTIDDYVWVRDGQTVAVPQTDYFLESEGFSMESYTGEDFPALLEQIGEQQAVPREFSTEAILYEAYIDEDTGESELTEVERHTILVNDPLEHKGIKLFQSDYIANEFNQFTFNLSDKETEEVIGEIVVDLHDPDQEYVLNDGYQVNLIEYYPNFELDEDNRPDTRDTIPNNPAFIFDVTVPEKNEVERSWIFIGQTVEMPGAEHDYVLDIIDVQMNHVSGLMVRKDVSLPVIYFGLSIVMVGLILCFYWQHRRIWVQKEGNTVWIAAHTNKNWFGLQSEVEHVIDQTHLEIDKEELDKEILDKEENNNGRDNVDSN